MIFIPSIFSFITTIIIIITIDKNNAPSNFFVPPSNFFVPPCDFFVPPSNFFVPPCDFFVPPSNFLAQYFLHS